jgi:hypothetical protein
MHWKILPWKTIVILRYSSVHKYLDSNGFPYLGVNGQCICVSAYTPKIFILWWTTEPYILGMLNSLEFLSTCKCRLRLVGPLGCCRSRMLLCYLIFLLSNRYKQQDINLIMHYTKYLPIFSNSFLNYKHVFVGFDKKLFYLSKSKHIFDVGIPRLPLS